MSFEISYYTSHQSTLLEKVIKVDSALANNSAPALRIFTYIMDYIPSGETVLANLKTGSKYIGVVSYIDSFVKLTSGQIYGKMPDLKAHATVLKVTAKIVLYLSIIPALLTSNGQILTAINTVRVGSAIILGASYACSAANRYNKISTWRDYLSTISVSALSLAIFAPKVIDNALVLDSIRTIGRSCSNVVFLSKVSDLVGNVFNTVSSCVGQYLNRFTQKEMTSVNLDSVDIQPDFADIKPQPVEI